MDNKKHMENKTTTLTVAQKLDSKVFAVIGNSALEGFEKAYMVAEAIGELKKLLTDEYMAPIMQLQGSKMGFLTDFDKKGGYQLSTVRSCLIEAVLMGLNPYGNEFNIISGNTYPTKEGMGRLLHRRHGLDWDIIPGVPKAETDKTSTCQMTVRWSQNGGEVQTVLLPISIKVDQYASVDSVIGKATRKARKWLYEKVTGMEITDGEVGDTEVKVVESKLHDQGEKMNSAAASALKKEKASASPIENKQEVAQNKVEDPEVFGEDTTEEQETDKIYTVEELKLMPAKDVLELCNRFLGMKTENVLFVGENKPKKVVGWLRKLILASQDGTLNDILAKEFGVFPEWSNDETTTETGEITDIILDTSNHTNVNVLRLGDTLMLSDPGEKGRTLGDMMELSDFAKKNNLTKEHIMGQIEEKCLPYTKLEDFYRYGSAQDIYNALRT